MSKRKSPKDGLLLASPDLKKGNLMLGISWDALFLLLRPLSLILLLLVTQRRTAVRPSIALDQCCAIYAGIYAIWCHLVSKCMAKETNQELIAQHVSKYNETPEDMPNICHSMHVMRKCGINKLTNAPNWSIDKNRINVGSAVRKKANDRKQNNISQ